MHRKGKFNHGASLHILIAVLIKMCSTSCNNNIGESQRIHHTCTKIQAVQLFTTMLTGTWQQVRSIQMPYGMEMDLLKFKGPGQGQLNQYWSPNYTTLLGEVQPAYSTIYIYDAHLYTILSKTISSSWHLCRQYMFYTLVPYIFIFFFNFHKRTIN